MKLTKDTAPIEGTEPPASNAVNSLDEETEKKLGTNFLNELEMTSSMVQTHRDTLIGSTPDMHNHNFYEILCCTDGGIEYLLEDRRYTIGPGDIIFVPPGVAHCPLYPDDPEHTYVRYVLWASKQFLSSVRSISPKDSFLVNRAFVLHTAGTVWSQLVDLFAWGVRESERKETGWEIMVSSNSCQLMVLLTRAWQEMSEQLTPSTESTDLQDQVLQYIQMHLSEKITLASTARHFLVCESTISQLFRKKMGQSFYRCVTQRRLVEAKNLIFQGLPLDQVSVQVGFQDYSSFYRAFKAEFGLSPTQYRKMLQK